MLGAWEASGELILSQIETEYAHRFPGLGEAALVFLEQSVSQDWATLVPRLSALSAEVTFSWAQSDPLLLLDALYSTGIVGLDSAGGNRWFASDRALRDLRGIVESRRFGVVVHPAFQRYLRCWGAAP
jgi:hypothetical protein